ncbi:hypothetical protein L484_002361 [Morus notabilis]|uniref:Uncharacterized protein n=1 Tax=Morus notabilis TaxID=981085 RepID=W9RXU6_9ROSA|nr:hypothetical protein L484_002361 [Morus notabilis]
MRRKSQKRFRDFFSGNCDRHGNGLCNSGEPSLSPTYKKLKQLCLRIGHLHHKRLGWCCGSGSENARVSEHGVDSGFESLPVEGGDSVRGENMGSEGVSVGRGGLRSETVLVG